MRVVVGVCLAALGGVDHCALSLCEALPGVLGLAVLVVDGGALPEKVIYKFKLNHCMKNHLTSATANIKTRCHQKIIKKILS